MYKINMIAEKIKSKENINRWKKKISKIEI